MAAMREPTGNQSLIRQMEAPRVFAAALVMVVHVVLLLTLQAAMRPDDLDQSPGARDAALTVEFLPAEPAVKLVPKIAPVPPPATRTVRPIPIPATSSAKTSVEFLEIPASPAPGSDVVPHRDARDSFDAPVPYKPFPGIGPAEFARPKSTIRLPDRPSMMQAHWAVPEGENLQGKAARSSLLARWLLGATGAIGGPHCPPESEHPDCLQRLLDDKPR